MIQRTWKDVNRISPILGAVCWTMNSPSSTAFTPSRFILMLWTKVFSIKYQAILQGTADQALYIYLSLSLFLSLSLSFQVVQLMEESGYPRSPPSVPLQDASRHRTKLTWKCPYAGFRDQLRSVNRKVNTSKQVNKVIANSGVPNITFLLYWGYLLSQLFMLCPFTLEG